MEMLAIGSSAFLPGFALAGVRTALVTDGTQAIARARQTDPEWLVIVEEALVRDAPQPDRAWLETSLRPLIISIGVEDSAQQQRLRRAIRNTLGVDLMEAKR